MSFITSQIKNSFLMEETFYGDLMQSTGLNNKKSIFDEFSFRSLCLSCYKTFWPFRPQPQCRKNTKPQFFLLYFSLFQTWLEIPPNSSCETLDKLVIRGFSQSFALNWAYSVGLLRSHSLWKHKTFLIFLFYDISVG